MIHIILTILKTAGILLLILIGLILFAVLSALLVPLRYSGQGKRESGRLEGRIRIFRDFSSSGRFHLFLSGRKG